MRINFENPAEQHMKEDEDDNFDIKGAIYKYLKYWPFILISVIIALFIAFIVNQYSPPQYKIESKFLIKEKGSTTNLFDFNWSDSGVLGPKGYRLANEAIILKSRPIAKAALEKLDFDVDYYEEGVFTGSEIYKKTPVVVEPDWKHPQITNGQIKIKWSNDQFFRLEFLDREYKQVIPGQELSTIIKKPILISKNNKFKFGEWVELPYTRFKVNKTDADYNGNIIIKIRDKESLLRQYAGDNLEISPVNKMSSILSLTLNASHPLKGRNYLNSLMEVFLENELAEKNKTATNTIDFIDSQIAGLSDTLDFIENKLENFRSSHHTYNISREGSAIFEQISELETSLSQEQFKKEYYQNLQEYLVKENTTKIIAPSGLGIDDPILNTLIENLIALQSERSRLLATQTDHSPAVKDVGRKIRDLNASLAEVLKNVNRNTDHLINDLENRIAKINTKFRRLPETEQNLLRLEREFSLSENIYTFLLQRRAESAISKASNTASNKIIEAAVPDPTPLSMRPMLNYMLALLLAMIISLSLISIIISKNVKITDAQELGKSLKVPIIAQIGQNKFHSNLVVMQEGRAGITEGFRSLRSNINFIFPKAKKPLTVMLTSSISGEGKTFCAINLASVYSISGKKTILVSCDMRKPKLSGYFNLSNATGLSTYLSGQEKEWTHLIQPTQYPHLDVMVEGPTPPNPAELLITDYFEQMVEDLKRSYDMVILDTPPIGLASESLDLMSMVDISLYLIRYNYSSKMFINHINLLREEKGLKNIYVLFNDVEKKELNYKGYGYGYYAEDNKKQSLMKRVFSGSRARAAF